MGWDSVTAVATVVQTCVVGVAAFVAVGQIRHLRHQNELAAVIQLLTIFNSEGFNRARGFVADELAQRLRNSDYRREIVEGQMNTIRHPEAIVLNYFNQVGQLIAERVVDAQLLIPFHTGVATAMWKQLLPVIALRRTKSPIFMIAFEALVIRCGTEDAAERKARYRALTPPALRPMWETSRRDIERAYTELRDSTDQNGDP